MPSSHLFAVLAGLLKTDMAITNVECTSFSRGFKSRDEVIVSHRYIFLIEGGVHYRTDSGLVRLKPGQQLFVPAWTRRVWRATSASRLLWCEFVTEHFSQQLDSPLVRRGGDMGLEEATLARMLKLWPGVHLPYEDTGLAINVPGSPSENACLVLEGELKASLARFWQEALPADASGNRTFSNSRNMHPDVKMALDWLEAHYQNPDALNQFYQLLPLSPNHFRILFKKATGVTVQNHLLRLRHRRARFLLHESSRPLKQIAFESGYENPQFFSRQYRKFWGHSPSQDRKTAGSPRAV